MLCTVRENRDGGGVACGFWIYSLKIGNFVCRDLGKGIPERKGGSEGLG